MVRTGHQLVEFPKRHGRPTRRWVVVAYLMLGVFAVSLTGCVSGNAVEQRQVETQEATRGAQLESIQETVVSQSVNLGTPDPKPTWTPKASLADLVLSSNINSDNSPVGDLSFISSGSTVYACARVSQARSGQKIIAVWSTADDNEIDRSEQDVSGGSGERWFAFRWQPSGIASGTYAVSIYIDEVDGEHLLDSLIFRVG